MYFRDDDDSEDGGRPKPLPELRTTGRGGSDHSFALAARSRSLFSCIKPPNSSRFHGNAYNNSNTQARTYRHVSSHCAAHSLSNQSSFKAIRVQQGFTRTHSSSSFPFDLPAAACSWALQTPVATQLWADHSWRSAKESEWPWADCCRSEERFCAMGTPRRVRRPEASASWLHPPRTRVGD